MGLNTPVDGKQRMWQCCYCLVMSVFQAEIDDKQQVERSF